MFGQIVVILGALALFLNSHPVVGVLGFFVAYEVIKPEMKPSNQYRLLKMKKFLKLIFFLYKRYENNFRKVTFYSYVFKNSLVVRGLKSTKANVRFLI